MNPSRTPKPKFAKLCSYYPICAFGLDLQSIRRMISINFYLVKKIFWPKLEPVINSSNFYIVINYNFLDFFLKNLPPHNNNYQ